MKRPKDIRINIGDLVAACRALHEVKVLAAGSLYATLQYDPSIGRRLAAAKVQWTFDD
jgi:hypothetical protein